MDQVAVLKTLEENGYSFLFKEMEEKGQEFEVTDEKIKEIKRIKKRDIGSSLTSRRY
ncbi:hypothetical protein ISS42_01480 [Candidatus Shapirobacteria bacterium]|nr:hypothetical protein [Candidatus Shapirobacteria bacterium]